MMQDIKSLLIHGLDRKKSVVKCDDATFKFYQDVIEECTERLKDVVWSKKEGWDFEQIEIVYGSLCLDDETLPELISNLNFVFAESLLQSESPDKRARILRNLEDEAGEWPTASGTFPDLSEPLLMAIKYAISAATQTHVSPWIHMRIGQLLASNTTWLTTFDLSERLSDEEDRKAQGNIERAKTRRKGGLQKGRNIDALFIQLKGEVSRKVHELHSQDPDLSAGTIFGKIADKLAFEGKFGGPNSPRDGTVKRWVKEAMAQKFDTTQPK